MKCTTAQSMQSEMARLKSAKKKSAEKRIFFILPIDKLSVLWYNSHGGKGAFLIVARAGAKKNFNFFQKSIDKMFVLWYTKDAGGDTFLFHGSRFFSKKY